MLLKNNRSSRAEAPEGWQPIGLPAQAAPAAKVPAPATFARDLAVARARRTARAVITPGVVLAAGLGATAAAAHEGVLHTPDGDVPISSATPEQIATYGEPADPSATTTVTTTESTTTSSTGSSTSSGSSFLPTGDSLPGSDIPTVGGFISHAPDIFTGGLFGGETVKSSAPVPEHGEGEHTEGGDACDFFLDHMWKNEDGIPVIGTNEHFLTYHTDPEYYNLPLSLTSGAIGNSHMPIVDIYGGPLGWIPVMNPEHVKGHGTDYPTMLTGCGGMGLPIDIKTGEANLDRIPTPEKVVNFAQTVMPDVPDPDRILHPDYLYNTLRVDEITKRTGMETVFTPDEYLNFATNNFDAMRLLWQTAFEKFGSGDPAAVLEVLQVTDNIKTLESVGLPGFSTLLGGVVPAAGTTETVTVGDKTYPVRNGKVTIDGIDYPVTDGTVTVDGETYEVEQAEGTTPTGSPADAVPVLGDLMGGLAPSDDAPASDTPGNDGTDGTTPSGENPIGGAPSGDIAGVPGGNLPGSDLLGGLTGGDSPTSGLPLVDDLLGGSSPLGGSPAGDTPSGDTPTGDTPTGDTPSGDTPTGDTPTGDTPTGDTPSGDAPTGGNPASGLPVVGDLLGEDTTGGLPVVGGLLGGGAPDQPAEDPASGDQPGSDQPGSDQPGSDQPGSDQPGSDQPGSDQPGGDQPGSDQPVEEVGFSISSPQVNGGGNTASVTEGDTVTFTVPVTNTGDAPITSLSGTASDGGTMSGSPAVLQPGQTAQLSYTTTAKPGTNQLTFNIVGASADGQQMAQTCTASYTAEAPAAGQIATTGQTMVGGQEVSPTATYTFTSTDPQTVTFQVTNSGDAPLQSVTASSNAGPVSGGKSTLAPGETSTYSVTVQPKSGVNQVSMTFNGVDASGATTTATQTFTYTLCTCGAAQAASQNS